MGAGAIAAVALVLFILRPPAAEPPRPIRTSLLLGADRIPSNPRAVDRSIAMSSDGSKIAYTAIRDGRVRLFVRSLEGADATLVPDSENPTGPFFSPDGRSLGFWSNGRIRKVSLGNLAIVPLCDAGGVFLGASWSPEGTIVFAEGRRLNRLPGDGGTPQRIGDYGAWWVAAPEVLPGGARCPRGPRRTLVGQRGHHRRFARRRVAPRARPRRQLARYVPTGHLLYQDAEKRLVAVAFDAARVAVTGQPVVVAERVVPGRFAFGGSGVLAYARGGIPRWRLAWVDRTGRATAFGREDNYHHPVLSPDARRIVVNAGRSMAVYDLERETWQRLDAAGYYPIWTSERQRRSVDRQRGGTLRRLLVPRRQAPRLLGDRPGAGDVLVLDLDRGRKSRCIVCTDRYEWGPAFSPDGNWLAYTVGKPIQSSDVFVHAADDSGGEIQISDNGGDQPLWSPTGRELFYCRRIAAGIQMMAVDVQLGPPFRASKPRLLFEGPYRPGGRADYAVTPDGQRFLMVQEVDSESSRQLEVVVNWFEELRARVRSNAR
jgi:hypothetical protein